MGKHPKGSPKPRREQVPYHLNLDAPETPKRELMEIDRQTKTLSHKVVNVKLASRQLGRDLIAAIFGDTRFEQAGTCDGGDGHDLHRL